MAINPYTTSGTAYTEVSQDTLKIWMLMAVAMSRGSPCSEARCSRRNVNMTLRIMKTQQTRGVDKTMNWTACWNWADAFLVILSRSKIMKRLTTRSFNENSNPTKQYYKIPN
jgi:hypothetical protein